MVCSSLCQPLEPNCSRTTGLTERTESQAKSAFLHYNDILFLQKRKCHRFFEDDLKSTRISLKLVEETIHKPATICCLKQIYYSCSRDSDSSLSQIISGHKHLNTFCCEGAFGSISYTLLLKVFLVARKAHFCLKSLYFLGFYSEAMTVMLQSTAHYSFVHFKLTFTLLKKSFKLL